MHQAQTQDPFVGAIADNYERYFVPAIGAPVAEDLIAEAALKPGERVLDVACGTGIVSRMALQKVAPSGKVAGLDATSGMLVTARALPDADLIDWYESSMESMPLPDAAFDVVLCQLGLQFVTDKQAALQEMHRVLTKGGRLLINVPGPTPPPFEIMADALLRHFGERPAMFCRAVFSLHDVDEMRDLAAQAGFANIACSAKTKHLLVPAPADFLWQYIQSSPLAGMVNQADQTKIDSLLNDVIQHWQDFAESDGNRMRLDVSMTTLRAGKD